MQDFIVPRSKRVGLGCNGRAGRDLQPYPSPTGRQSSSRTSGVGEDLSSPCNEKSGDYGTVPEQMEKVRLEIPLAEYELCSVSVVQ